MLSVRGARVRDWALLTVSLALLSLCEGSSHHEAAAATSNSRQCALSSTQMCALGSHTVPMHVRARSCAM